MQATELEYLKWFYQNMDFGPAHGDVMLALQAEFQQQTNKQLPDGYEYE